jgi:adenine/guanine phosphoribosyltransferase-like PRPP-binding protein
MEAVGAPEVEQLREREPNIRSSYLYRALEAKCRREVVEDTCAVLRKHTFDAIAVSGFSGTTVGSAVAHCLDKALIIVRKGRDYEQSHASDYPVEGMRGGRYVVVDDFISGGETMRRILREITKFSPTSELVGAYLWATPKWRDREDCRSFWPEEWHQAQEKGDRRESLKPGDLVSYVTPPWDCPPRKLSLGEAIARERYINGIDPEFVGFDSF